MIRLSVIVPTYNAEKYIEETIKSIIAEINFEFDELVVVDDCSSDNTVAILKNFENQFSKFNIYQTLKNSGGPAIPRNIGIRKARGEYIAFCDADDIWIQGKVALQLSMMHNGDIICSSKISFKDNNKLEMNVSVQLDRNYAELTKSSFLIGNPVVNSSVIRKKSILLKFLFQEKRSYIAIEDYDLWLRMQSAGYKFIKCKAALVFYRKSNTQISFSKLNMAKKVFNLYLDNFGLFIAILLIIAYSYNHVLTLIITNLHKLTMTIKK